MCLDLGAVTGCVIVPGALEALISLSTAPKHHNTKTPFRRPKAKTELVPTTGN